MLQVIIQFVYDYVNNCVYILNNNDGKWLLAINRGGAQLALNNYYAAIAYAEHNFRFVLLLLSIIYTTVLSMN